MRVHGPDLVEVLLHVPSATPAARQHYDVAGRKTMPRAVFLIHGAFALQHDEPLRRRARRRAEPASLAARPRADGHVSQFDEGPCRVDGRADVGVSPRTLNRELISREVARRGVRQPVVAADDGAAVVVRSDCCWRAWRCSDGGWLPWELQCTCCCCEQRCCGECAHLALAAVLPRTASRC